jgi:hypothetical protein
MTFKFEKKQFILEFKWQMCIKPARAYAWL